MVFEAIKVLSSLSKHNSKLNLVQFPCQLVTGNCLIVPKIQVGQYCQDILGGPVIGFNCTDLEKLIDDCLYWTK